MYQEKSGNPADDKRMESAPQQRNLELKALVSGFLTH
jgi:hypothetical protein